MKVQGAHTFTVSRDVVWPMFLDPNVLANVLPGCEKLEAVDDNQYQGVLNIRVGPVQGKFDGVVTLSDIQAPESYRMEVDGRGPAGFVKGAGNLRLEANGDSTILHYDGDAQVGGRIARVGQRLLDTSARAIIRQSLEGLEQQIEAQLQTPRTDADSPAPTMTPPTQTEFAAGVARNMLQELIPPENQGELLTKGLLLIGGIILIRFFAKWWMKRLARKIAHFVQEERR